MTVEPRAWLTRSGKYGERDDWAVSTSVTPGGFGEVADLSQCRSLDDARQLAAEAYPEASKNAVGNYGAQLWALAGRMAVGDLVVLPLKATSQIAIGEITGDYRYDASEPDPARRHVRPVMWLRTDVARTAVKQDLLYSLGAFSTYCQVSRNEAVARLKAVASGLTDPGTKIAKLPAPKLGHGGAGEGLQPSVDSETLSAEDAVINLEEHANDRIVAVVQEEFAGHRMAVLVEALLTAEGYTCWRAPEGADGGIDLLAGSGPFGPGCSAPRRPGQERAVSCR